MGIRVTGLCAAAFIALSGIAAAAPFDFDHAFGRLPKNVVPIDYAIAVTPNIPAGTYTGTESILLKFRAATTKVQFNTLNERLWDVRLDGKRVARKLTENARQLTTLTLATAPAIGLHRLTFAYAGRLETAPQGLFVQHYRKADGSAALMIATMFESTDARRMFPCWDEPAFRATFKLTMTVPAAWKTVANMPEERRVVSGALATTTFRRSPKMPSYLVAFAAGDLASVSGHAQGTLLRVDAVKGREKNGYAAVANAKDILADYNAYFDYKYPLPKLDLIAMPGGFQGGMENWGAIVFTDGALLTDSTSTIRDRQEVYSIEAHEMAHQWNGDLVTMGWWDDLWLNESFASWRSAKETDLRNPSWHWWEEEDKDKESAMDADARLTSHPIAVHIADEAQSENAFDGEITYAKGQAFLRMMESYLGDDTFRDGVRRYIKARAFSNATGSDLWNALSAASGQDVARIAETWTSKSGYPLVSVAATCDASGNRTIALTQQRFLLGGKAPGASHWMVPLSVRTGAAGRASSILLTSDGQSMAAGACADPLLLNAGTVGFYRVAYDVATLEANQKAFGSLANNDRLALLDDQWALVRAGRAPLSSYLGFATAMGGDLDVRAWQQIDGALGQIEEAERGTHGYGAFLTYARSVIAPVAARLGWHAKPGEDPDVQSLRHDILNDFGIWGDRATIAEANRRFAAFVRNPRSASPDEQEVFLPIVAARANAQTFEALHALAKGSTTDTERDRYYGVLATVRDPRLARRVLAIAQSPEIPPQRVSLRYDLVRKVGEVHPEIAWPFLRANYNALLDQLGPEAPGFVGQEIPQTYWRAASLATIKAFLQTKIPADLQSFVNKGLERAAYAKKLNALLVVEADASIPGSG